MKQKSYFGERKTRVKMYKEGSHWVSALMTLCGFELLMSGAATPVHADSSSATTSSSTPNIARVTSVASSATSQQGTLQPQSQQTAAGSSTSQQHSSVASSTTSEQASTTSSQAQSTTKSAVETSATPKTQTASSTAAKAASSVTAKDSAEQATNPTVSADNAQITQQPQIHVTPATAQAMHQQALQANGTPVVTNRDATSDSTNQQSSVPGTQNPSTRGIFDDFDHWGTWSIYFYDENGNTIYPTQGYTDAGSDYVDNQVTAIVDELERSGYEYDYMDPNKSISFDIGGVSWTYIALVFKQVPRQVGGTVSVQYKSTDGKVLAEGTATYKTPLGEKDTQPHVGDTYQTQSREFTGYHLQKVPANASGDVTSSAQTVVYMYAPDTESVKIDFIDQNVNNIVKEVTVSGGYGETATFNVQDYVNKNLAGYEIVSSNWPNNGVQLTENSASSKPYQVILKHKTSESTQTKTVTQTINYDYSDGTQALAPKVTKITFTRTVTTDEVTGQQTFGAWTTTDSTTFPAITSPTITGYTPSPTATQAVTGVTADSPNDVQTVIYVANKEQITVTFYDMDEGRILQQQTFEGSYGTSPNFDYQNVINGYIKEGYNVARDTIPSSGLKFTDSDNQNYEVDLTHTHTKLPADAQGLVKVITHTIHYIYANGSTAEPDVVQNITYTRGATKDNVTGAITYTDWTTKDNPEFPAVTSPTISGYTPSMTSTPVIQVNGNSTDVVTTVVYNKDAGTQKPQSPTKTTVTETINYVNSNGTALLSPTTVTKTFTRTQNADGTYGPWTTTDGTTFPAVDAPQITGYTPSVSQVAAINNVTATTANIVRTIVYTPVQDTITINYVDQTENGKIIHTDTYSGTYDSTTPNTTQNEITALENQGYKLVDNGVPNPNEPNFTFTSNQTYTITFVHTYTEGTQEQNVNETINYQYQNGTQAADPYSKTLSFTRSTTKDNVTGQMTYGAWSPVSGEFPAVTSPTITGYTASQKTVDAITGVNGSTTNIVKTVVYTPVQETVTVTYVDDTTGKTITVITLTGGYDTNSTYSTAADIKKLESGGYDLVSDGFPADGITFGKSASNYTVHMKERIVNVENTKTVTQTINYVDQTGKQVADPHTATITFTQPTTTNAVTGQETMGAWTPSTQTFAPVKSPTITGYTPSQAESSAVTVDAPTATTSPQDNVQTITYTPNEEKIEIQYIDQTTGKVLQTDYSTGTYGTESSYNPAKVMAQYVAKGYVIVSDDFPMNGVKFDQDGTVPVYKIVMKHGTTTETPDSNPDKLTLTKTVTRTIKYQYANGDQAEQPVTQTVTFTRTATKDNVTGAITYSDWEPSGSTTDPAVTSPTITGYTPSETEVPAATVSATDSDSTVTVTYTANKESAIVNYVDATTGKVLHSDTLTGTYGSASDYDPNTLIKQYEGEGYKLESNDYPANGEVFNNDGKQNVYTIKFVEGTTTETPSDDPDGLDLTKTVTQTIHYKYADGTQAAPDHTTSITFTRTATKDDVTGAVTYGPWTNTGSTDEFEPVTSPTITGYTPSAAASTAVDDVTADTPNNVQTITYTPNQEKITVTYVDETTGKELHVDTLTGAYNTTSDYSPADEIAALEKQGYVLDQDGYPQGGAKFDTDGKVVNYTITFKHGTTTETPSSNPDGLDLTKTVTRTIKYQYANGDQAEQPVTQTVTFTRTATKDNVTGAITYSDWEPSGSDDFTPVDSPVIDGYNPSVSVVAGENNVPVSASDSTDVVTYDADTEKATVTYVDDTTGKTLQTVTLHGKLGTTSAYSPSRQIKQYEGEGYQLVGSDYPAGGVQFSEPDTVQHFVIHLTEGTTTETPDNNPDHLDLTHTVKRTITYVGPDGKQVASPVTQTITFHRTATKNNVTGAITYGPWESDGTPTFGSVTVPTVAGLTPDMQTVPAVPGVTATTADTTVTVKYGAPAKDQPTTPTNGQPNKKQETPQTNPASASQAKRSRAGQGAVVGTVKETASQTVGSTQRETNENNSQQRANQLPDTGDQQANGLWGLVLLVIAGILSFLGIKPNKRNDGKNR